MNYIVDELFYSISTTELDIYYESTYVIVVKRNVSHKIYVIVIFNDIG